jgi:dTDP-4-dehydrorhamnose reductase
MRIAVTGVHGQVVCALRERASSLGVDVVSVGRPRLDLSKSGTSLPALRAVRPNAIVHAAGYTAVDLAENDLRLASQINIGGTGEVAAAARALGVPIVYLSTDYVFDGKKDTPYVEDDTTSPLNLYGLTKLAGENAVAGWTLNHAILRISWIYSPFGKNFVRTILHAAKSRDTLNIVADQHGTPCSAFDVADGIVAVVKNLVTRPDESALRGVFHMAATGETTWAGFGQAVFAASREIGGPFATVDAVASKDYPQVAKRPANSRLDSSKLAWAHDVQLPEWRSSLKLCVERIVIEDASIGGTA